MKITQRHIDMAQAADACGLIDEIEVGQEVSSLDQETLSWCSELRYLSDKERDYLFELCGSREWWVDDTRHRIGGPAMERPGGYRSWWVDDKLHRTDGPAVERPDGYRAWYLNGELHRIGGPAIERSDGSREWWVNGMRHRIGGPAIECPDGYRAWWVNDRFVRQEPE